MLSTIVEYRKGKKSCTILRDTRHLNHSDGLIVESQMYTSYLQVSDEAIKQRRCVPLDALKGG